MTILCPNCGSENHVDAVSCLDCGADFNKTNEYIVCTVCGLSNIKSAETCIGCSEKLENNSFTVKNEETSTNKKRKIFNKLTSRNKDKIKKKAKPQKKLLKFKKIVLSIFILFIILLLGFGITKWMNSKKIFIESDNGFYFITSTNELHIITEKNKEYLLLKDITEFVEVKLFNNRGYFLAGTDLYEFNKSDVNKISSNVRSYKIDDFGKRVLYTSSLSDDSVGDLYLYDKLISTRIDGNVNAMKFSFGYKKNEIFYVADENIETDLGTLYMRIGDKAPLKLVDDVFMPLVSKSKGSVYFVRDNIDESTEFTISYVSNKKVSEVARNISNIIISPYEEKLILIQNDGEFLSILKSKKGDRILVNDNLVKVGLNSFSDINDKVVYCLNQEFSIFSKTSDNTVYRYYVKKNINSEFEEKMTDIYLSNDGSIFYFISKSELSIGNFDKRELVNVQSMASGVNFLELSETGETVIFKNQTNITYLLNDKYTNEIDIDLEFTKMSENDKYLIYLKSNDELYALKIGAKSEVLIDTSVSDVFLIGKYIYSNSNGELNRYKLGNYSSNKLINTIRFIDDLK